MYKYQQLVIDLYNTFGKKWFTRKNIRDHLPVYNDDNISRSSYFYLDYIYVEKKENKTVLPNWIDNQKLRPKNLKEYSSRNRMNRNIYRVNTFGWILSLLNSKKIREEDETFFAKILLQYSHESLSMMCVPGYQREMWRYRETKIKLIDIYEKMFRENNTIYEEKE